MQRRYDLDWLRVLAFALLMLFHTGMMFSSWNWHIKNLETSQSFDFVMGFVHQWRMPLLFFISGSAVWFAMDRYAAGRYFLERQKRLLLPLTFGILVIIPPQIYVERLYHHQQFDSFWDFYLTVFSTGSYPQGNLSWHHLWYVPYIWTYSMLTLPAFLVLRSNAGRRLLNHVLGRLGRSWWIVLIFLPSALSDIALRPYWPGDHQNLVDDWANFFNKLCYFVLGFALASSTAVSDHLARHRNKFLAAGILAMCGLQSVWWGWWQLPPGSRYVYHLLSNFTTWMWILALLGYGRRYLGFNHPALRYANEAVYPFYILHQTVIVILGYQLIYLNWGIGSKFLVVVLATFAITWVLYQYLIKRNRVLRVAFGMKAASSLNQAPPSGPARDRQARVGASAAVLLAVLLPCVVLVTSCARNEGRQVVLTLDAPSLATNLFGIPSRQPMVVYLPPSYDQGSRERRYPVLYLLPNFNHNLWRYTGGSFQGFRIKEAMDEQIRAGAVQEMLVVLPNTTHWLGGSWYRNSPLTGNWEDYITRDVVSYIDENFRTLTNSSARAIAGHGMGGTGALELACKRPDLFACVYALSPGLFDENGLRDSGFVAEPWLENWQRLTQGWRKAETNLARRSFRNSFQTWVNSYNPSLQAQALSVSYAAAAAPDPAGPFPHFQLPSPGGQAAQPGLTGQLEELFGGWPEKLRAYTAQNQALRSITIEHGGSGDYDWIQRGTKHLSGLMSSMSITHSLAVHTGGHDGNLGYRLRSQMLPTVSRALNGATE